MEDVQNNSFGVEQKSRIYNSQRDKTLQNSLVRATHIYSLTRVKLDTHYASKLQRASP